jgi:hypothetical protein
MDLTYEEYKKWLDIKVALEGAGMTDSSIYKQAVRMLIKRPVPPYPKADARISKNDII